MRRALSRPDGLWRHPDFLKLWAGQTVSVFGDQIAFLALPLVAVLTLEANAVEMGILGAAERAPFLLVGLFAGVWADRVRRRPILIGADIGRVFLLGSIPAAALFGWLTMPYLYVVAFLVGILTVFFDVAYQSYLPVLVSRDRLVEGNTKLEVSNSVATIAGPGLAGALVQLVTAPMALLVDACSFVVSVVSLLAIGAHEPAPRPAGTADGGRAGVWQEIGEGLHVVLGSRILRAIAGCTGTSNLFSSMTFAVFLLYVTRDLGISPALLGVVLAAFGPGGLLGALLAGPLARRLGVGRVIVGSIGLGGVMNLLVPLASGPVAITVPLLIVWGFIGGAAGPIYNITQVSLRQQITPDRVQGRMNATMRFIVWGTMPIGALLGGFLGQFIGLRTTLLVGALGSLLAILWVYFSPVRALHEAPPSAEEAPALVATAVER
jgi:MFS family permease